MHEVQLAEYLGLDAALARVDVGRWFELRVPGPARVPRDPGRRRRHGRDRLRQQPALGVRAHARHRRWRRAAAAAWRCRSRCRTSSRPGITLVGSYAMAAQRHMHEYGTTPEQLASIAVQTREHAARNPNAMYRDPITVDDVLVVQARRRSAAQARLLRHLRRRLLHHPHDRGTRARPAAPARVRARRGRRHDAPLDPGRWRT